MSKERKLPFKCMVEDYGIDLVEIKNPFSGESISVPPDAAAVYDVIIGEQLLNKTNWDNVRKGLDWFKKHEPEAYMVLLD